jgi:hypothetical protein
MPSTTDIMTRTAKGETGKWQRRVCVRSGAVGHPTDRPSAQEGCSILEASESSSTHSGDADLTISMNGIVTYLRPAREVRG